MGALAKRELFERLAQGHAAGIAVVTPNRRLAQSLAAEFDAYQVARGLVSWEAPDILPWEAFAERCYEDALYAGGAAELPPLLTPAQEQALWEREIAASRVGKELLDAARTAQQCRDAWRLKHAWRLDAAHGNEDVEAFASWSASYRKRTASFADSARLPDLAARHLAKKPKLLVAYGFDILPPQTQEFLSNFEVQVSGPDRERQIAVKTSYPSKRDELESAARWARARLEGGARRIGLVVPELEERRREVVRVLTRVVGASAFNVSLGEPLGDFAPVNFALDLLEWSVQEKDFSAVSRILRSPYLGGAEAELHARARLDFEMRRNADARMGLAKIVSLSEKCKILRKKLEAVFNHAKTHLNGQQSPQAWARHISALLEAAGFPGERALDSAEYQARAKFNELLGEFARLDRVSPSMNFSQGIARLRFLCQETLFQPEGGEAPLQVLGVLESAGAEFDGLWVSGLTDEAWPLAARPNPFLPIALQKKAGIPEASAESSLALDRRITEGWMRAAGEVVFSHPLKDEDRDLAPSPLIAGIERASVEAPDAPRHRDVIFASGKKECFEDSKAPPLSVPLVRGGTRVLADQSACPFRAFARWRLGAQPLEAPAEGPDAAERGQLLHALMKALWGELKKSGSLQGNLESAIRKASSIAVKQSGLDGPFAALEEARLAKLAAEWLEVERKRGEFEIHALEEKRTLHAGGLELSGRIDRMDRLAGGGHALIDYKSGRASTKDWEGERPEEPQLPLYAVNAKERIAEVGFAKLKTGEMKYLNFETSKSILSSWKKTLDALGRDFAAGEARVDPKRGLQTCRYCDLQPLCRVYEKLSALEDAGEGE